jgi:hypothetical protein
VTDTDLKITVRIILSVFRDGEIYLIEDEGVDSGLIDQLKAEARGLA